MNASDVAAEARRWLGVPYLHQGRSRLGLDCIGYVIVVRKALGSWPESDGEVRNYGRRPKDDLLRERMTTHLEQIDSPEEGAVILIRWPTDKYASHCAIYAGGNILHAYQRAGAVIESGYRAQWLRLTHSFWRLPGVTP